MGIGFALKRLQQSQVARKKYKLGQSHKFKMKNCTKFYLGWLTIQKNPILFFRYISLHMVEENILLEKTY